MKKLPFISIALSITLFLLITASFLVAQETLPISLTLDEKGMSKELMTVSQYCVFLNDVAKNGDRHHLFPSSSSNIGGVVDQRCSYIQCTIQNNLYTYTPVSGKKILAYDQARRPIYSNIEIADYPITNISLLSAARFCNWMHHKSHPEEVVDLEAITETGAYSITESPKLNDNIITLSSGACWRLPHYQEIDSAKLESDKIFNLPNDEIGLRELTDSVEIKEPANHLYILSRSYYLSEPFFQANRYFYNQYASQSSVFVGFRVVKTGL